MRGMAGPGQEKCLRRLLSLQGYLSLCTTPLSFLTSGAEHGHAWAKEERVRQWEPTVKESRATWEALTSRLRFIPGTTVVRILVLDED